MPAHSSSTVRRWIGWVLRILGFGLFVLAFFLPAVRGEGTVFAGWKCASIALSETVGLFGKSPSFSLAVLLVVFSGWINPLVVLTLLISFVAKLRTLRRILGILIVLCMAATWTFFVQHTVTPLVGHWLWIAGALLILVPEVLPGRPVAAD